jgi:catechol 2,3-dioxygenase-like lactoylglutathione lyase family enzyme
MSLDHIGFGVVNFQVSRAFYESALAPLGLVPVGHVGPDQAMFGRGGRPQLWIGYTGTVASPMHIAFSAESRAQVAAFHKAALAAGGRDNGGPGLRPQYHPHYYGAFVFDPDGHNVEAVCHAAE